MFVQKILAQIFNNAHLFLFSMDMFPYDKVRPEQDKLVAVVKSALIAKKHLIIHAPTGLGKTVALLSPCIEFAIKNKLTIFFLTSRHTQHILAIDTCRDIKKKGADFYAVDVIGKKWMCLQPGANMLSSTDFHEYCRHMTETGKCEFYTNTRSDKKLSVRAKKFLEDIPFMEAHSENMIENCQTQNFCPYEIVMGAANDARVIVTDYYYVFHPSVSRNFLGKIDKNLSECIVIVDEAHNLPFRIKDLASSKISNFIISRSIKELRKLGFSECLTIVEGINDALTKLAKGIKFEEDKVIKKEEFTAAIKNLGDYEDLIETLENTAENIRDAEKQSYTGSIAHFLSAWQGSEDGFTRILSKSSYANKDVVTLSYKCLDPSIISADIIKNTYATFLMSGTLLPTEMYNDLLGFPNGTKQAVFNSPFPQKNRLNLIVPKTTTKFTERTSSQYQEIAKICAEIVNTVPGNSILFFPSYGIRDSVNVFFSDLCKKTIFIEDGKMDKTERKDVLERFKTYAKSGAVILAVSSGSFSEGIDLPGDYLKCVVVVGLPLQRPDTETKEQINYFDTKFKRGWDYGYIFPAFSKCLQGAGRCIRTETDRGVVIFLDERFNSPQYYKLFPRDLGVKVTLDYNSRIKEFFGI